MDSSPASDAGTALAHDLDCQHRSVPDPSGLTDVGAFEHDAPAGAAPRRRPAAKAERQTGFC